MSKKKTNILIVISIAIVACIIYAFHLNGRSIAAAERPERFVAHAGGMINGYTVTNSLEALHESVRRGYNLIEVDIVRTTDGKFVLSHVWEFMSNRVPLALNEPVESSVFENYRIFNKFTPVTLHQLFVFLDENPHITIITDTKYRDYSSLRYIAEEHPALINRFIPQIYLFEDFDYVRGMGFDRIIATVYDMPVDLKFAPDQIAQMASEFGVYAVAIPDELMHDPDYIEQLNLMNINFYVHTINNIDRARELFDLGVVGIYSNTLGPGSEFYDIIDHFELDMQVYANRIDRISQAVTNLPEEKKDYLRESLIYRLGDELAINRGTVRLINDNIMQSCFINEATQNVWVPFQKTAHFIGAENLVFFNDGYQRGKTFSFEGSEFRLVADLYTYEKTYNGYWETFPLTDRLVTFTDTFFVSEAFLADVFGKNIIRIGEFIVVTHSEYVAEDSIAEMLEVLLGVW